MDKKISFVLALAGFLITTSIHATIYSPTQLYVFEKTNRCVKCNLSNAHIGKEHQGAKLDGSNLTNLNARRVNLTHASLLNANLTGARLNGANLSGALMTGVHLEGAHLSFANLFGAKGVNLANVHSLCHTILPNGRMGKCGKRH